MQAFHSELPSFKKALDAERAALEREALELRRGLKAEGVEQAKELMSVERRLYAKEQRYNTMLGRLVQVGDTAVALRVAFEATRRKVGEGAWPRCRVQRTAIHLIPALLR